ncbi:MAG: CHAT domain-containing protein [Streptosporangiaceae bacterium]
MANESSLMANESSDGAAQLRALLIGYSRTAEAGLLDRAIDLSSDVIKDVAVAGLQPGEIAVRWSLGGAARLHRSRLQDHPGDLDDAIVWFRRALQAAPKGDGNRPSYASNLATAFAERYDRDKNRPDLNDALRLFDWAVSASRAIGHDASVALHNQGQALLELFKAEQDMTILDRAIEVVREAVAGTAGPETVAGGYLTTLGQALQAKAQAESDPSVLDEAVEVLRRAEEWTTGSDDHVAALVSLGTALLDRSEMERETQDLAASASFLEQALTLVNAGTPRWAHLASNLGNTLVAEFRATGRQSSLLRARDLFQDASAAFADSSPDRETCLSNLAACLQELHEQTGELSFLDEAIDVFRATVNRPGNAASPERLHNFGVSLLTRFKRYQSPDDLDQAISQFRAAAEVSPPNSVIHAAATNSLGNALFLRFDLLGHGADMDAAIGAHEEAVRNAREDSVDRALYRANLGVSLAIRGQRTHSAKDIDAAVSEQENAVASIPSGSQEYIRVMAGLADSLAARALLANSDIDASRARAAYRQATMAALNRLPEQAIGTAQNWGTWAITSQAFAEAAEASACGLQALEQLFATQLTRLHKETWLRDAQGISIRAAYARAMVGDTNGAAEAFERGRALMLSEALQRDRADVKRLATADRQDLQGRYERAVSRWNQLSRSGDDVSVPEPGTVRLADRASSGLTEDLREAREELDAAIAEIRTVPGYRRFLLPPAFSDLVADAGPGPLVYLGATESGGLALAVHPESASVTVAWLPELTEEALAANVGTYREAYQAYLAGPRTEADRAHWQSAIEAVTEWAWMAVMAPVLETVGDAPRATLVPAGLLGVLPLHAAWVTDRARPTGRRYALDQIVLTYAPNAQAVAAARKLRAEIRGERLVAVDEPDLGAATAWSRLPFSAMEVAAAAATFSDRRVFAGRDATVATVLAGLSQAQFFHLSCHGRADPASPLDAALAMAGGQPLTLRDVLDRRLHAKVGVLSACETAIPGDELPDEVVALPAGLIQAGVGAAVASLWSVPGAATALLMFRFYERWRVGGSDPAQALREAQCWLRDTTTGEKISYFEDIALNDAHPMTTAAQEPYELLYGTADPTRRDYQNPYHWAAFSCVGA